jgi:4-phytase / acid phosphatase
MMRATVLTPLLLLGWSLQAIGQSPARLSSEQPSLEAQSPAASENELKLVVALFRHGVRAPLPNFSKTENDHSQQGWPDLADWNVPPNKTWGDLTTRGQVLATALGSYYAEWYKTKNAWPGGFSVYLWADTDQRTIDTAEALAQGFRQGGPPNQDVTVGFLQTKTADPLFHPFKAGCGIPDPKALANSVANIEKGRRQAAQKLAPNFDQLETVLSCTGPPCLPLKRVVDAVTVCIEGKDLPKCESPIIWHGTFNGKCYPGQFPYASSASEAFLLEYANSMPLNQVGWGQIDADNNLHSTLQLHEAYFDLTEREPYLAKMGGSNLTREILDLINRKAGRVEPIDGKCPRANKASQFVGLVGHDTNIADVGKLLHLSWQFTDAHLPPGEALPPDTRNLPDNDALPAGALVFELRERPGGYFIRVNYVAQSLLQMRGDPKRPPTNPFRFSVTCHDERGASLNPCELPLDTFNKLVTKALGPDNPFLSRCGADGNQICR